MVSPLLSLKLDAGRITGDNWMSRSNYPISEEPDDFSDCRIRPAGRGRPRVAAGRTDGDAATGGADESAGGLPVESAAGAGAGGTCAIAARPARRVRADAKGGGTERLRRRSSRRPAPANSHLPAGIEDPRRATVSP